MARDYYEVLDVPRDADAAAIKKAYKSAARKHHPDLNQGNPAAEALFKEASEAYDVLSNDDKRRVYDQYGHEGLKGRGFDPNFTDMSDIFSAFSDLFGGGFAEAFGGGRGRGRGSDLEVPIQLTFMEAAHGVTRTLTVPRQAPCEPCRSTGLKPGAKPSTCGTCAGQGQVITAQGFLRMRTVCPTCRGAGRQVSNEDRCTHCRGAGRVRSSAEVEVRIPAGSYSGLQIRLNGKGDAGEPNAPAGDLYLTLDVEEHAVFKRDGSDVYATVDVPYPVMCLGGSVVAPTVHGDETISVRPGTPSGHIVTLTGKGIDDVRQRGRRGNALVRLVVGVPTKLGDEEEALIRQLAVLKKEDVSEKGFWAGLFDKLM